MWFDDFYWAQVRLETPGNFYNIFEHLSQQKVFLEEKKSQFRMVWNTIENQLIVQCLKTEKENKLKDSIYIKLTHVAEN